MNIADVLTWSARKFGTRTALIEGARRLTFAQVAERAERLVQSLRALGVAKGERVAMLSDTGLEYAEVTLAIPAGGMTLVPLNYRFIAEELAYTVNDCGVSALIVSEEFLPTLDQMRPLLNSCQHIVVIGAAVSGTHNYEELMAAPHTQCTEQVIDEIEINASDIAYIIYTSGTTSKPKGVMRSHKSLIATATATAYHHELLPDDVCMLPNPPFHISYAWPLLAYYSFGCPTVIGRWDTEPAMQIIEKEKVSFGVFVPYYVRSMLEHPRRADFDLSSLRRLSIGSAPMDEDLTRRALSAFGRIFNFNYGMTEYGSPIAMMRGDDIDLDSPGGVELLSSVGKAVFNADVRVVDGDGADVVPGSDQAGEVIVRGDALMSGYWKMPEETAISMRDGYFHTGDVAKLDSQGNLYIVDRLKDMIITGGENVYCPEVEGVLMSHPAVLEAAVLGVPDDTWGEAIKALVLLRNEHDGTEDELRNWCRSRLAGYKIPKSIEIRNDLPRTPVGKVSKKDLRDPYWVGHTRKVN
ncbi:MAG: long-chain acyl-CoA synthetase [Gammaproteobacteria bacterium]|jgi:long-chain acyl-CoA synthetase